MRKPKVILENYERVYDYYGQHRPNKLANRIGHGAMGLVFRPRLQYAEGAQETIGTLLTTGNQLIIASNHVNDRDQYAIASMAQREPTLHPMRGRTFIPTKESLSKNWLLRRAIDAMDAVPTFRKKDVQAADGSVDQDRAGLQQRAASRFIETAVQRLDRGDNMAIFPEGTRNKGDSSVLQKLRDGLGIIACEVKPETQLAIVPVGLYYGEEGQQALYTPHLHIGTPITERFDDPRELTEAVTVQLQASVDGAIQQAQAA